MNQSSQKKNTGLGCLWLFLMVVISSISLCVLLSLGLTVIPSLVLSILFGIFISIKMVGKPRSNNLIKAGAILTLIIFVLISISNNLVKSLRTELPKEEIPNSDKFATKMQIKENTDSIYVYTSKQIWKDNYGNNYTGYLTIRERDFLRLRGHTSRFRAVSNQNFWGDLYDYIDRTDTPSLDLVMDTFRKINLENNLNQMEFAEMVVSCIQNIPYALVFQNKCLEADSYEESIKSLLQNCPQCCIGNILYGVQTPVSFLQNLKGDCDTRTVIIYSILKYFGYDVAIVNSDFYRHSIIGINLPGGGLHKIHHGKKYLLWETTAKYYEAGYLSPSFNNVTHWNVVLTSK